MAANGLRAEDVAVMLQISFTTVQRVLTGKRVHRSTAKAIADMMGVARDTIMVLTPTPARKVAS